jgi:hypothetical protein
MNGTAMMMRGWSAAISAACGAAMWLGMWGVASACNTTTVCFQWITEFTDSSEFDEEDREDYLIEPEVPARGARVEIIRPAPEDMIMTTLNRSGCVTFATQYANGHRAKIYTDSVIGGVRLRAAWGDYNVTNSTDERPSYPGYFVEVDLQSLEPQEALTVPLTTNSDWVAINDRAEVAPLYAASVAILSRIDDLGLIPTFAEGSTLAVAYLPTSGGARCNCDADDGDPVEIVDVGVGGQYKKFMLAHEFGHWVHLQHREQVLTENFYTYPVPALDPQTLEELAPGVAFDAPCAFSSASLSDNETMLPTRSHEHALRSAEHGPIAHLEGYAHFISAAVHNDLGDEHGWYRYYKEIDDGFGYDDLADGSVYGVGLGPAVALGGERQWIINQCPNDREFDLEDQFPDDEIPDDGRKDDVGVELDWFRFWWRFATEQSTPQPLLAEIAMFVGVVGWDPRHAWPGFEEAVANPVNVLNVYEGRFVELADEEGIQNGS